MFLHRGAVRKLGNFFIIRVLYRNLLASREVLGKFGSFCPTRRDPTIMLYGEGVPSSDGSTERRPKRSGEYNSMQTP